ncbi:MAG: hypothetical protein BWX85_00139 [Chloroflexi bacterium ADurb.Bin120]|nr:MAG: hypothetical protein BWX85_00139 [Chloroflexi bacterium ADurb.Bin120]
MAPGFVSLKRPLFYVTPGITEHPACHIFSHRLGVYSPSRPCQTRRAEKSRTGLNGNGG